MNYIKSSNSAFDGLSVKFFDVLITDDEAAGLFIHEINGTTDIIEFPDGGIELGTRQIVSATGNTLHFQDPFYVNAFLDKTSFNFGRTQLIDPDNSVDDLERNMSEINSVSFKAKPMPTPMRTLAAMVFHPCNVIQLEYWNRCISRFLGNTGNSVGISLASAFWPRSTVW